MGSHVAKMVWLAIVINDGDECTFAWPAGPDRTPTPVMGTDDVSLESTRAALPFMAKYMNQPIKLVRFTVREDLETIEP